MPSCGSAGRQGFSLIEAVVAMFIFTVMTLVIMGTFFDMLSSRARVRAIQQDVEDARYGMELMAKTLRMSSVFTPNGGSIEFYDYSRSSCFRYKLNGKDVTVETKIATTTTMSDNSEAITVTSCDNSNPHPWISAGKMISGGVDSLHFDVTSSTPTSAGPPGSLGHVTIAMKICDQGDCTGGNDSATIQSSVSLRDYGFVNGN